MNLFNRRGIGAQHEEQAARFLKAQGAKIVTRNFHSQRGEIDLIAIHDNSLCFVEVRYRKNTKFGGAAASVSTNKQTKLIACAQYFLQQHTEYQDSVCRFDVIAIDGKELNWIQNAFQL